MCWALPCTGPASLHRSHTHEAVPDRRVVHGYIVFLVLCILAQKQAPKASTSKRSHYGWQFNGSCFYQQISLALLSLPDFYLLTLHVISLFPLVSHIQIRGQGEGGELIGIINSYPVWKHETSWWVKFSCAADLWITRQHINGCLRTGVGWPDVLF